MDTKIIRKITKDEVKYIANLREILYDESGPRQFIFYFHWKDKGAVEKCLDILQECDALNITLKTSCFQQFNSIELGPATFNIGVWNYFYSPELISLLVKQFGPIHTYIDVEDSDAYCLKIDEGMNVIECFETSPG